MGGADVLRESTKSAIVVIEHIIQISNGLLMSAAANHTPVGGQGRTQDFCSGGADEPSGGQWRRRRRRASAAGARIEALAPRGVGAGGGVPLPRQLGGLGERCKLPQWGPGRSPGRF